MITATRRTVRDDANCTRALHRPATHSLTMQRASLAVSTWFRLPEYMERLEILSRGSAFRLATGGVVASAHVLAPWRFPNYFPEEWVKSVGPEHTRYFLERRSAAGVVEACTEACAPVCHADRDAAVLTPIDAGALDALGVPALDLALVGVGRGRCADCRWLTGGNIEDPPARISTQATTSRTRAKTTTWSFRCRRRVRRAGGRRPAAYGPTPGSSRASAAPPSSWLGLRRRRRGDRASRSPRRDSPPSCPRRRLAELVRGP